MEQKSIAQVCVICERVKVTEGTWLIPGPLQGKEDDTDVSHGICPECVAKTYPESESESPKPTCKK